MNINEAKELVAQNLATQHFLEFSRVLGLGPQGEQLNENLGIREMTHELIQIWIHTNGNSATPLALAEALFTIHDRQHAEQIFPGIATHMSDIRDGNATISSALHIPSPIEHAINLVADNLSMKDYYHALSRHPEFNNVGDHVLNDFSIYRSRETLQQLLLYWRRYHGTDATVERLANILESIGNVLLAQQIRRDYQEQTNHNQEHEGNPVLNEPYEPGLETVKQWLILFRNWIAKWIPLNRIGWVLATFIIVLVCFGWSGIHRLLVGFYWCIADLESVGYTLGKLFVL